jgi:hypothetical protein
MAENGTRGTVVPRPAWVFLSETSPGSTESRESRAESREKSTERRLAPDREAERGRRAPRRRRGDGAKTQGQQEDQDARWNEELGPDRGLGLQTEGRHPGNAEHCTGDVRRTTVEGRILPGSKRLRNASRDLSPMLAARQRQLEERAGSSRQAVRTARQEIDLAAPTADPSLDPS